MRDFQDVLKEKCSAVERIRREIEALRLVTALLADEGDGEWDSSAQFVTAAAELETSPLARDAEDMPRRISPGGTSAMTQKVKNRLRRIAEPLFGTLVSSFRA